MYQSTNDSELTNAVVLKHKPDERELAQFSDGVGSIKTSAVAKLEKAFENVEIDALSKLLFTLSNNNVAFVGAYDQVSNKLYLYPLVPWLGNDLYDTKDFDPTSTNKAIIKSTLDDYSRNSKKLKNSHEIEPIKHVPGDSPSHKQICEQYGLDIENCIGFSITKNSEMNHTFSAQSVSLNKDKFKQSSTAHAKEKQDAYIPIDYVQFLMSSLNKTMPKEILYCEFGDGVTNHKLFSLRPKISSSIDINKKDNKDLYESKKPTCGRS